MVLGSDLRRRNTRRVRGTVVTAAMVLVFGPALAACSDDSGGGSSAPPPTPSVERTTSAPATAPADPAAATTQVKANWKKFFDPASTDKQAVLENGDKMGPVLKAFSGDKRGGQVQADVQKVEFTSATQATVTYSLTLNGATALPNASGTSVQQGGTWKVSVNTLCALVALSGDASQSPGSGC
ncbi:hypothetical protein ACWDG9_27830 [Streptomyces sp. NPDC001073]